MTFGVVIYYSNYPIINLCDIETCPFCYGDDYCVELNKTVKLNYDSITNCVFNLFSVKNVYFGTDQNRNGVVLKKLAQNHELQRLERDVLVLSDKNITVSDLKLLINKGTENFYVCDSQTSGMVLEQVAHKNSVHLWTIFKINFEPIILEIFNKEENWPVPKLYGYCGRSILVEDCGVPLNRVADFSWEDRAYIAYQLLKAAHNFSISHKKFRLYLTDVSPDNIAVNPRTLQIAFVDLEHGVLQRKIHPGK